MLFTSLRLAELAAGGCQDVALAFSQQHTTREEGAVVTAERKGHKVQAQSFGSPSWETLPQGRGVFAVRQSCGIHPLVCLGGELDTVLNFSCKI